MIYFEFSHIVNSVFCSVLYGLFFSLFYLSVLVIKSIGMNIFPKVKEVLFYKEPFYKIKRRKKRKEEHIKAGPVLTFILTLLFFLGFILLSYYALDGEIRLYMLLICSGVFLLSYKYPTRFLFDIAVKIILILSDIILLLLRIITLPLKLIINIIEKQRINKQSALTGTE